ncbi:hypothetical protein [Litorisediminicola beolgyonensis]|uniref:Lipoprotein n=1 Tax=Litorisediminicola beolgyonensis TaxID=1173614 RepID=A0ABW3ZM31_9RHOB
MRLILCLLTALALSACGYPPGDDNTFEEVSRAPYRHDGPPSLTLFTMVSNTTGAGEHSSLMINAPSQRVIFDPAGSVRHSAVPERQDVLYGITPRIADFYARAHARESFHVRIQDVEVPPDVAEKALALAQANGRVPYAFCASATAGILRQLRGFESIRSTLWPKSLANQFAEIPGVREQVLYEDDSDDKRVAIEAFQPRAPIDTVAADQPNR